MQDACFTPYKALKPGAKLRIDTVRRLLAALGVKLDVSSPGEHVGQQKRRAWSFVHNLIRA